MELMHIESSLVDANLQFGKDIDAIISLNKRLVQNGYVDEQYEENIITREKNFPTGLQFPNINIAMPHGDNDHVMESAICVGKCKQEIMFHLMENPDETILVNYIVLLAVKNPDEHMMILSHLMEMLAKEDVCQNLKNAKNEEEIVLIFKQNLF